ncbi:MAG TPA: response regulator [Anaerolineales bacterium]|jgi:pilus assembly protein CpaE|nr:response regulator [Anaerolineales bacterium]
MPAKLLIADDDMDTLRLVGLMLERQGYDVLAASSGNQVLSLAKSTSPDLILLDVMMPDIDGYEVTRRLRADPDTANIPIIMFTAKAQLDDKLTGFDVGADDYLTKPTQPQELFAHIKAVLSRVSKTRELAPLKERGKMIAVVAAKGGLGVTTLALNLGIALQANQKKDVIVAEFRPGQGSMSLELGYQKPDGFNRLLECEASEVTARMIESELVTYENGIRFLMGSIHSRDATYLDAADNFEAIANRLSSMAEFIILDLGPVLAGAAQKILAQCDEIIIVVDSSLPTIARTKAYIQDLVGTGIDHGRVKAVLVNRIRSDTQITWTDVQEQVGRKISMVFTPAPELTYQASLHNIPVVVQQPDSLTAEQFFKLAEKVA